MPITFNINSVEKDENAFPENAGRVRSGMVANGRPMSLDSWRFTLTNKEIAEKVAAKFGGTPETWDNVKEPWQVLTEGLTELDITINSPRALSANMVLWGRKAIIRECSGVVQNDGKPCVCPSDTFERKQAGKDGTGCEPSLFAAFTIDGLEELGSFVYRSGAWTAAEDWSAAEEAVAKIDGPVKAKLITELVEFTTKDGEDRRFRKPVLKVLGPADTEPKNEPF